MNPKKPALTRFLCLPLVTEQIRPELEQQLAGFRQVACTGDSALPQKAVRPIGSIHLTIGVMSLDEDRLEQAADLLKSVSLYLHSNHAGSREQASERTGEARRSSDRYEELQQSPRIRSTTPQSLSRAISPPPTSKLPRQGTNSPTFQQDVPVIISLASLKPMHSPRKTSVLFAQPIDPSSRLHDLCLQLRQLFTEKGFLIPDDRPLKLHATIVNTIYVKGRDRQAYYSAPVGDATLETAVPSATETQARLSTDQDDEATVGATAGAESSREKHGKAPLRFDATSLIERYKDHIWASDIVINHVAICEMGAKDIKNDRGEVIDQRYNEVASASLYV